MNATSDIAVVVDGVHKVFGGGGADDVTALAGIDLAVVPGEFVSQNCRCLPAPPLNTFLIDLT